MTLGYIELETLSYTTETKKIQSQENSSKFSHQLNQTLIFKLEFVNIWK